MSELETSITELESRYKEFTRRRDRLQQNKMLVEAEHASRLRELKNLYKQAEEAGFDPNNIKEELRRRTQVLVVKLDTFQADLEAAEALMQPMMQEIQRAG